MDSKQFPRKLLAAVLASAAALGAASPALAQEGASAFPEVNAFREHLSWVTGPEGQAAIGAFLPESEAPRGSQGAAPAEGASARTATGGAGAGQGPGGPRVGGGGDMLGMGGSGLPEGPGGVPEGTVPGGAQGEGAAPQSRTRQAARLAGAHAYGFLEFGVAITSYMYVRLSAEVAAGRMTRAEMNQALLQMLTSEHMYVGYLSFLGFHEAARMGVGRTAWGRGVAQSERAIQLAGGRAGALARIKVAANRNMITMVAMVATEMTMGAAECLFQCPWERQVQAGDRETRARELETRMREVRDRLLTTLRTAGRVPADRTFSDARVTAREFEGIPGVEDELDYRELLDLERRLGELETAIATGNANAHPSGCPSGSGLVGSFMESLAARPFETLGHAWTAIANGVRKVDLIETFITGGAFIAGATLASFIPYLGQSGIFNLFVGFLCAELADRLLIPIYRTWRQASDRSSALGRLAHQWMLIHGRRDRSWLGGEEVARFNATVERTARSDLPAPPAQTSREQRREQDRRAETVANPCLERTQPQDPFVGPIWDAQEAMAKERAEEVKAHKDAFEALALASKGKLTQDLTNIAAGRGWRGFRVSFLGGDRWTRLDDVLKMAADDVLSTGRTYETLLSTQMQALAESVPILAEVRGSLAGRYRRYEAATRGELARQHEAAAPGGSGEDPLDVLFEMDTEVRRLAEARLVEGNSAYAGHRIRRQRAGDLAVFALNQYLVLRREQLEVELARTKVPEALRQARTFLARVGQHRQQELAQPWSRDRILAVYQESLRVRLEDLASLGAIESYHAVRQYVERELGIGAPPHRDQRALSRDVRRLGPLIRQWKQARQAGNRDEAARLEIEIEGLHPEALFRQYSQPYGDRLETLFDYGYDARDRVMPRSSAERSQVQDDYHAIVDYVQEYVWREKLPRRSTLEVARDLQYAATGLPGARRGQMHPEARDAIDLADRLRTDLGSGYPPPGDPVTYVENFDQRRREHDRISGEAFQIALAISQGQQAYQDALDRAIARLLQIYGAAATGTRVPANHPGDVFPGLSGSPRLGSSGGTQNRDADFEALRQWLAQTPSTPRPASDPGMFGQESPTPAPASRPAPSGPLSNHEVYQPLLSTVVGLGLEGMPPVLVEADRGYPGIRRQPLGFYRLPAAPRPAPAAQDPFRIDPRRLRGVDCRDCHPDPTPPSFDLGRMSDFFGTTSRGQDPYPLVNDAAFRDLPEELRSAWFLWWDLDAARTRYQTAVARLPERQRLLAEADRMARDLRLGTYELPEFRPQLPTP